MSLYNGGDFLLVRNGGIEDRIPLTQIDRVQKAIYSQPPRVTIRLNRPGKFGETIVYSPEGRFALVPWAQNATNDLIERIEAVRSRHVVRPDSSWRTHRQ